MPRSTEIKKHSLDSVARELDQPWLTYELARFDDIALQVFTCQGMLDMHRHLAYDELFLVHSGNMILSSERGDLSLRAEELVVVPKGTGHQVSAIQTATVAMFRVGEHATLHRNGQWRILTTRADPMLQKINLGAVYIGLTPPYRPVQVARYEGWRLWLMRCIGEGPIQTTPESGMPMFIIRGALAVMVNTGQLLAARAGEVLLLPGKITYHIVTDTAAMVLWLEPGY